jgi:hypothetical protein
MRRQTLSDIARIVLVVFKLESLVLIDANLTTGLYSYRRLEVLYRTGNSLDLVRCAPASSAQNECLFAGAQGQTKDISRDPEFEILEPNSSRCI